MLCDMLPIEWTLTIIIKQKIFPKKSKLILEYSLKWILGKEASDLVRIGYDGATCEFVTSWGYASRQLGQRISWLDIVPNIYLGIAWWWYRLMICSYLFRKVSLSVYSRTLTLKYFTKNFFIQITLETFTLKWWDCNFSWKQLILLHTFY